MIDYFLTSTIILLVGLAFYIYPPVKLYGRYGYRSKAAMRSPEKWRNAQDMAAGYLLATGTIGLLISILLFHYGHSYICRLMSVLLPILMLCCSVLLIEKKLK